MITVVLQPTGKRRTPSSRRLRSRRGTTQCTVGWQVVELWKLPAEDLLRANDVGLVPWVPLTDFSGPPEPVFQRCRELIDRQARRDERANLLAVSQILAGLRYNDPGLFQILGGEQVMIESPVLQEFVNKRVVEATQKGRQEGRQEGMHRSIQMTLEGRFGTLPEAFVTELSAITDEGKLVELARLAGRCPDLEAFRSVLRG